MKRLIILLLLLPSLALAQGGMGPGPGVKAYSAASTWHTAYDANLTTEYNWGLVQKTFRQVIPASTLSNSGTKVKVTFNCSTAATKHFYINNAGICEQSSGTDCNGSVTQITFAGGFPVDCTGNGVTSSEITFTIDKTKAYLINFESGDDDAQSYVHYNGSAAGFTVYSKQDVHESLTATVTGYTTGATTILNVDIIEVYGP